MSVTNVSSDPAADAMARTVLDYGDQALMVQCDSTAEVLAWTDALRAAALPGVVDVVPALRTVLVKLAAPRFQGVTRQRLRRLPVGSPAPSPDHRDDHPVIDVVYDGPDLAEVASHTGLTAAQIINAHTAAPWRVGFNGFSPGFAYLIGGDPRLRVPRKSEPRTVVPAGSVALAGEFSAIYPRQSPGGWQIIGHTEVVLWDVTRPNPALLMQGMWVRFRAA
ncbi:5-oxoprolinase subunit B family protein [Mycobacterium kansasii]|uniref:Allophanate hydrolase n=3 Tax=Mycobacterium kansasii TaxID=1768 RepID=A0A653F4G4_MYCKA|nr:allophanate hydrolase subunit 1 [Mycobacterium kansasii]AGZ51765.1 allophanate hydrolase [Mycobacterium kansasii ATCC 12478]ARG56513.1 allophanate hydrolase [Mycobacterium kansasii]ARG61966.1 allophanate hydrolase [Mycobacterium kansasii]ARG69656.1 allophanate hydrolase [Mycobacterium kansasii]ARG75721.1 allophanate hydrolase [Mycobacterium kansasii]